MEIQLNEETLCIQKDHSFILKDSDREDEEQCNWEWIFQLIELPLFVQVLRFIIDKDMYIIYQRNITLVDIRVHLILIKDILDANRQGCQSKMAEEIDPSILGGAAITATFIGLDDFLVQKEMYKRRRSYIGMHRDIGIPSLFMVEHHVLHYGQDKEYSHTISEFNGTFLPHGQAIARHKNVFIGKEVHLLLRIIYLYLCDQKQFQDWCWGIDDLSENMKNLYDKVKSSDISPLPIKDLKVILPSMDDYTIEDIAEIYQWYTSARDIKYLHALYPQTRSLFLQYPPSHHVLSELVTDEQYVFDIVSYDIEYIQYVDSRMHSSLIEMETDDKRLIKAIILTGRIDCLDMIYPSEDVINTVKSYISPTSDRISCVKRAKVNQWLREAYIIVPSLEPIENVL